MVNPYYSEGRLASAGCWMLQVVDSAALVMVPVNLFLEVVEYEVDQICC